MRKQDDHTCPWSRWWAYVTLLCLMAVAFPCGMAAGPDATKAPQKALPSAAPDVKLKLTPKQLAALNTGFSNLLQQRQTLLQSNTTSQQPGNSSNPVSTAGGFSWTLTSPRGTPIQRLYALFVCNAQAWHLLGSSVRLQPCSWTFAACRVGQHLSLSLCSAFQRGLLHRQLLEQSCE